jgi:hypothetical protein
MPLPKWKMVENERQRQRVCVVCGAPFRVAQPSNKRRTCSAPCHGETISRRFRGTQQAAATVAKRSLALRAWNADHPEQRKARVEAAARGAAEWLANPANAARIAEKNEISRQLMHAINRRNASTVKIIMRRAARELRAETDYCAVFADVQARLRRELPYDGPKEGSDYAEYLHNLGRATAAHPMCQEILGSFMRQAIPRITKEVRAAAEISGEP